jgi:hypothetical protein
MGLNSGALLHLPRPGQLLYDRRLHLLVCRSKRLCPMPSERPFGLGAKLRAAICNHRHHCRLRPQLVQEVGDAAQGGQVLLTHEAWLQLCQNTATAGWPVVEMVGMFKVGRSWLASCGPHS